LLRFKWCPDKVKKLEEAINKVIPDDFDLQNLTSDQVEEIDYLQYFAKELL